MNPTQTQEAQSASPESGSKPDSAYSKPRILRKPTTLQERAVEAQFQVAKRLLTEAAQATMRGDPDAEQLAIKGLAALDRARAAQRGVDAKS